MMTLQSVETTLPSFNNPKKKVFNSLTGGCQSRSQRYYNLLIKAVGIEINKRKRLC